jgi:nitroreductase
MVGQQTRSPSVIDAIKKRYSCRMYQDRPIEPGLQTALSEFLKSNNLGPLGTRARFGLIATTEEDLRSLKGLGTYGFIKGATGFIVGAFENGPKAFEDFGYLMEHAILRATSLGLGTCWLGGSFSKSGFAKRFELSEGETMPAVVSTGYIVEDGKDRDRIRKYAGASQRLPRESLFFEGDFNHPITEAATGSYKEVLEMVRWAPSASNKQPWRIVRTEAGWHFYLARNKNYGKGTLLFTLLRIADLQRVDMGIAMCHFALSARELGLKGDWVVEEPTLALPERTEYTVTWRPSV